MGKYLNTHLGHQVVVEFVGLPGVGKSTLATRVAQKLRGTGVVVSQPLVEIEDKHHNWARRVKKLQMASGAIVGMPRRSVEFTKCIWRSKQRTWADLAATVTNVLYLAQAMRDLASKPSVHVFDQGIYQAFWSVGYSSQLDEPRVLLSEWRELLSGRLPEPMIVVVVVAELRNILERLSARGGNRSRLERDLVGSSRAAALKRAQEWLAVVEELIDDLSKVSSQLRVLHVANDDEDLSASTGRIVSAIRNTMCWDPLRTPDVP